MNFENLRPAVFIRGADTVSQHLLRQNRRIDARLDIAGIGSELAPGELLDLYNHHKVDPLDTDLVLRRTRGAEKYVHIRRDVRTVIMKDPSFYPNLAADAIVHTSPSEGRPSFYREARQAVIGFPEGFFPPVVMANFESHSDTPVIFPGITRRRDIDASPVVSIGHVRARATVAVLSVLENAFKVTRADVPVWGLTSLPQIHEALPRLNGKLHPAKEINSETESCDRYAYDGVPLAFTVHLKKPCTPDDIRELMREAAEDTLRGALQIKENPRAFNESDIVVDPEIRCEGKIAYLKGTVQPHSGAAGAASRIVRFLHGMK